MAPRKQPWFRFYVEAIWDRKLRRLSPSHRWLWVVVLACAKSSPDAGYLLLTEGQPMTAADLADAAALTKKDVATGLGVFVNLGLIDRDTNSGGLFVVRWKERQFESDTSTDRTGKHRSKEQVSNGDVTPPETETEEPDSDLTPPTPPQGGQRANGTNPRAKAQLRERNQLIELIRACTNERCDHDPDRWTVLCGSCSGLHRKLMENAS